MCGRTACTLSPACVPLAASTVTPEGKAPQWKEAECGHEYAPSPNTPPTKHTPVLCRGEQVRDPCLTIILT